MDYNSYASGLEAFLGNVASKTYSWAHNLETRVRNITYSNEFDKIYWVDFEISLTWDEDFRIIELTVPIEEDYNYDFIAGAFYMKLLAEEERRDEIINE